MNLDSQRNCWGVRIRRADGTFFLATNAHPIVPALFGKRWEAMDFIKQLASPISPGNKRSHISRKRMRAVKLLVTIQAYETNR